MLSFDQIKLNTPCLINSPVGSYSRAQENILAGPLKHFHGPIWKRFFFWIFLFKMVYSGVLYISGRRRGFQTSQGPR